MRHAGPTGSYDFVSSSHSFFQIESCISILSEKTWWRGGEGGALGGMRARSHGPRAGRSGVVSGMCHLCAHTDLLLPRLPVKVRVLRLRVGTGGEGV